MKRGKFITIYGVNNVGKTTHAERLVEFLEKSGKKASYIKYPIYDIEPSGFFLNDILRSRAQTISEEQLQLWFVLNRFQFQPKLETMLRNGVHVVAEDYCGTGIGWGIAKGVDKRWLESINKPLLREDFSLYLSGRRVIASVETQHIHEQDANLMKRATKVFDSLAKEYGWHRVEICANIDDTAHIIAEVVQKFL